MAADGKRRREVDTVLFDFGGVFTLSPFTALREYARSLGSDPMQVARLVFGDYHQDTDHPWHCLERGEIPLEEARRRITRQARDEGLHLDIYEMLASFPSDGGVRQEMIDKAGALRRDGYQLAVVTNNVVEFHGSWQKVLPRPVEEMFHLVVDSSREGVRKPDPAIFRRALQRLGDVPPGRAVFLDDFEGNLRSAQSIGLRTVLVGEDIHRAIAELDAHLAPS